MYTIEFQIKPVWKLFFHLIFRSDKKSSDIFWYTATSRPDTPVLQKYSCSYT